MPTVSSQHGQRETIYKDEKLSDLQDFLKKGEVWEEIKELLGSIEQGETEVSLP